MLFRRQKNQPPLERAIELARRGETVPAEELLVSAARAAERKGPAAAVEIASAWNDLGTFLNWVGQPRRAAEAFRSACKEPAPAGGEPLKDHLTYLLNYGCALDTAGDPEGAEAAFRSGLNGRLRFYGRGHPGYAFGLEPLADLLIRQERAAEALPLLEESVRIFWQAEHPRLPGALALRAEALAAAGDPTPPFAGLVGLPDEAIGEIAAAFVARGEEAPTQAHRIALERLAEFASDRLGADADPTLQTLTAVAEHERRQGPAGDIERRIDAIRRVLESLDRTGRVEEALNVVMGLGLALHQGSRLEEAAAAQRDAIARAESIGEPALISQALRNAGLFFADAGRREDAEPLLRRAVAEAEPSRDIAMAARAQIALGIFLQHGGRLAEAKPLLQAALRRIEVSHPDAITARSHLSAIENGGSCGCGDTGGAIVQAFREFILARLPAGLLRDVTVDLDEKEGLRVGVELLRRPTEAEVEHMNRVIEHATVEFKRGLLDRPDR